MAAPLVIAAIGNTTCRLALLRGDPVADAEPFAHEHAFSHDEWREGKSVREWLDAHARSTRIGICSVVPALTNVLLEHCESRWSCVEIRAAAGHAMRVEYETPETLGADRYCAALGAREMCGSPVIAVDFGTAITVNVVDARGVFVGGAILPGYAASLRAMHEATAQLPMTAAMDDGAMEASPVLGRSTQGGMRAGVIEVLSRGVDAYARELARGFGVVVHTGDPLNRSTGPESPLCAGEPGIFCTGGGASYFFRVAGRGWRWVPDLVLRGCAQEMQAREALEGL